MAESLTKIGRFLGTDNASDQAKLQIGRGGGIFFTEADNVDIDDENMLHRRQGWHELVVSGDIHNIWANGSIFLFTQGSDFKRMNTDYSTTVLITDIDPTDRMAYVAVNDLIFFSNHGVVGFLRNGASYPFPDPGQTFKQRMVGGQILEFYNNRLYAAHDDIIYYSDATVLTRMDRRKNAIPLQGRVTMMKAVEDGLYVSAGDITSFLAGKDPAEFIFHQITDTAAIEGTAVSVDGENTGRGVKGRVVYWMCEEGIYRGYPGGMATLMQDGRFSVYDLAQGTAIVKDDNGYVQYLSLCELRAGLGGASGEIRLPKPELTGS